jgi:4-aminobutyrate aminotransferase-like enzyme
VDDSVATGRTWDRPRYNRSRVRCLPGGVLSEQNVIRLSPPLIITEKEADIALTILEEALNKVEKSSF